MGCMCTNATKEDPNGRYSEDLMPKSKPRSMGVEEAKGEIKQLENHMEEELEKPNSASNDEPCHVGKIRLHN
jgi:hypothetical protein